MPKLLLASTEPDHLPVPQPFVTAACAQNEALSIVFSMDEEWSKVCEDEGASTVTGVTVVRKEFLK